MGWASRFLDNKHSWNRRNFKCYCSKIYCSLCTSSWRNVTNSLIHYWLVKVSWILNVPKLSQQRTNWSISTDITMNNPIREHQHTLVEHILRSCFKEHSCNWVCRRVFSDTRRLGTLLAASHRDCAGPDSALSGVATCQSHPKGNVLCQHPRCLLTDTSHSSK